MYVCMYVCDDQMITVLTIISKSVLMILLLTMCMKNECLVVHNLA